MELFTAYGQTTVSSGGTTAPAAGTPESWTVSSSTTFPSANSSLTPPTWFRVADPALPTETILVTNVSGTTWTVTRGTDGTTPVAHASGFTIRNVMGSGSAAQWPQQFNVRAYGAKGDNSTDDSTAFSAAITAAANAGTGTVYVPAGSYKIGTGQTIHQDINFIGEGSTVTSLYYTGSGTLLTLSVSGSFTGGQYAGTVRGFYMDGYSAGSSAVGVQVQDLQGLNMQDVEVAGFGGKGIYYTTGTGYAEESTVQARIVQCGTYGTSTSGAVVFDSTSFDYGNYDFTIVTSPGVHGVVVQNNAQLRGCQLRMRGNFYARASANTGAVIAIEPAASNSNTGYITDSFLDVAVELAVVGGSSSGFVGHTSVLLGSSNSNSQLIGQGVLSFNPNGNETPTIYFQGFSNANFVPFGFSGYIQDGTSTGTMAAGDAFVLHGGTEIAPNGSLSGLPGGSNQVYMQFGDVIEFKLANGANTLGFNGTTGYVRKVDLWIAQPSSGAAGTVTWPSVKWPSATAPTLSSTNGYVDHVRLTYLPDTAAWYGELVGTHYA